jgi:DNA polymerase I
MSEILIVDGNAFAIRAFYNGSGIINGFLNYLTNLGIPDYLIIVFDYGGQGFRHDLFPGYKANRPPKPEELSKGLSDLKSALKKAGVCILEAPSLEGDDIIASVSIKCLNAGFHVRIATSDHDFFQLVNDRLHLNLVTKSGFKYITPQAVRSLYGFNPIQIIDYKALTGDSDGYKGVNGIGEKTAKELVIKYGSLDKIYQKLDTIKSSVANKLVAGKSDAYLCFKLATMITHLKVRVDRQMCKVSEELLVRLFSI